MAQKIDITKIKTASQLVDFLNSLEGEDDGVKEYDIIVEQNGWFDLAGEKISETYWCITDKGELIEMDCNGTLGYRNAREWADCYWDDLSEEAKAYIRGTGVLNNKN
jgi:hypothetical protein